MKNVPALGEKYYKMVIHVANAFFRRTRRYLRLVMIFGLVRRSGAYVGFVHLSGNLKRKPVPKFQNSSTIPEMTRRRDHGSTALKVVTQVSQAYGADNMY